MTKLLYKVFLLLLYPSLFSSLSISQPPDLLFQYLTSEDGLSNNCVQCIVQDKQGFMWFGTSDGLNRWDGYNFKIFTHNAFDSNSISGNYIYSLYNDSTGRIWIGTNQGLNNYDPITETIIRYQHDQEDTNSISNNLVNAIFSDRAGNLWMGTENGLNRYNPERNNFDRFFFPGQLDSVSFWWNNNIIRAIHETEDGKLLLGTVNDFLIFDPKNHQTTIVPYVLPERKRWPTVASICKDKSGHFWIGILNEGVIEYDPHTGIPRLHQTDPNDPYSYHSRWSTSIVEDRHGQIWIGTSDKGFCIFDRTTGRFTSHRPTGMNNRSLSGCAVNCFYQDRQGNMWIGTGDNGINVVRKWKKPFMHYTHDPQNPHSLAPGEVTNFYEDRQGTIWITHIFGVSLFNRKIGNFTHITSDPQNPAGLSPGTLFGLYEDKFGDLWFAITPDINQLNPRTGKFTHYQYSLSNPKSHSYTFTTCCREDGYGNMWFGTANAGLERLNRADRTFDRFCYDPTDTSSISDNGINTLYLDKGGRFWIGTDNGLCQLIYDQDGREKFIRYQPNPAKPNSISGKIIASIYEDRIGRFWIGTNGGLNLFDREKNSFTAITKEDGLPINSVLGIIEDDQGLATGKAGNLWLRTKRGIVKFNPETHQMRIYNEDDGLTYCNSIEAGYAAFYKTINGEIYSGSTRGFTVFYPDSLKDNPDTPVVVLTDLEINYNSVGIGSNSPLQKSLVATDTIKLDHFQNTLTIEFAALDYTAPYKNQYAYKLEGINQDWIYTDAWRRFATYTNLDPGKYVFRVKGSNNDGVWNENGVSLSIIISPPLWKTVWAYTLYLLFFGLLVVVTWRFQVKRIRVKNELKMQRFESQKLQELDRMKSRFFANISHEFRTPLTLILGPISLMLSKFEQPDLHENLTIMRRSALRLQRLINQLLDLSKLEAGRMKLQTREENIISLIKSLVLAFESLAKLKHIQLVFRTEQEAIVGYIDRQKLETVVNNLLSNAFKFTPQGGKISVIVHNPPVSPPPSGNRTGMLKGGSKVGSVEYIEISISDTGCGIPADRLPYIFDRFYQVDDSYIREQEGSGIGLALVRELVEFHKGEISVSSEIGKGTTFVIRLPVDKEVYGESALISETATPGPPSITDKEWESREPVEIEASPVGDVKKTGRKSRPVILIVEDNPDMRSYLRGVLESDYHLLEARDGKEGFRRSVQKIPDLIISDVMMPGMDGFELCQKLKTDPHTSHIPVVLLTARAASEDRICGLETGADDYIIKPFNAREMQVRVKNLLEQRRKLRERFLKEGILQTPDFAVTSADQKFLHRVQEVVENHILDDRFSVVTFAREVGMSRALLHRKLRALIDHSPSEFIRTTRLHHAARILAGQGGTISEVAYGVGFNNLSYFARCFHRQFGVSPSQYASQRPTL
ncbi:MAG: response regulator [bacterium]|nr:MAG: response regulator [bacterium]